MFSRFIGLNETWSPWSTKPRCWPPPSSEVHALLGREVLGLLALGLQDRLRAAGQRVDARRALVAVDRLEDAEQVHVAAVPVVAAGADPALTAAALRERVPVQVVAEDVVH